VADRRAVALGAVISCLYALPGLAADDATTRALVDQATFWQSKGRADRATEIWNKLLRVDPQNPEALLGLGLAEVDLKNMPAAQAYLERLRRIAPSGNAVARLEQAIRTGGTRNQIDEARSLARAGKSEEALARYRSVYGERPPEGRQGLEYYQTLGGTAAGWEDARKGLEMLVRENPQDRKIALALAEHLTYREATRREGLARLMQLSNGPDVGKQAETAWRRALGWLPAKSSSLPFIEAYLERFPDDAELRDQVAVFARKAESERATEARDMVRRKASEGFRLLDGGNIAGATAAFWSVLTERPGDPDALGGLGLVKLREEKFAEARDFLERASRAGSPERWRDSLASATYWSLVASAESTKASDPSGARAALERAISVKPGEVSAILMLAGLLDDDRQLQAAETYYRKALAVQPDNPDALRGLVGVLSRTGRGEDALRIVDQLTPQQQDKIGAVGTLRAEQLRLSAHAAVDRGDYPLARLTLEDAVTQDPGNPWARYELASVMLKLSGKRAGREVLDGLELIAPGAPETRYVQALFAADTKEWAEGLRLMEEISHAARTADVLSLQRRLWVNLHSDQAIEQSRAGRRPEALARLSAAERQVGKDVDLAGVVASAYAEIGDTGRAMSVLRSLMASAAKPSTALRIQYVSILLKTGQDQELAAQLRQLQNVQMKPEERQSLDKVRLGYVVRQVEALRKAGNLVEAYDLLAPALAENVNDVVVQSSLARLYMDAGEPRTASGIYDHLLQLNPDDKSLHVEAANAASTSREFGRAEALLQAGLAQWPDDPALLAALGRTYKAQGQNGLAMQYLEASVAAERQRLGQIDAGRRLISQGLASKNPFQARSERISPDYPGRVAEMGRPESAAVMDYRQPAGFVANPYVPAPVGYPSLEAGYGAERAGVVPEGYRQPSYGQAPHGRTQPLPAGNPFTGMSGLGNHAPQQPQFQPAPVGGGRAGAALSPAAQSSAPAISGAVRPANRQPRDSGRLERQASNCETPWQGGVRTVAYQARLSPAAGEGCAVPGPATRPPRTQTPRQAAPRQRQQPAATNTLPTPRQRAMSQLPPATIAPLQSYPSQREYLPLPDYMAPETPAQYAAAPPPAAVAMAPVPASTFRDSRPLTVEEELNELRVATVPMFSGAGQVRSRQGEDGLGRLTELQSPLEWSQSLGDGRLVFGVTPVTLDSGRLTGDYNTSSRFGGGPVAALNQLAGTARAPGVQAATGIGFSAGYVGAKLSADIGSTPLGFEQSSIVGGLRYRWPLTDKLSLAVSGSRRAMVDSLLSFAGATDSRSGLTWGGVTATGGRVDLNWDDGRDGFYGYAGYYTVNGENVASNSRIEAGVGLYTKLIKTPDSELTIGTSLTALGYDHNLRHYTFGHGGYFSPQSYVAAGVPVSWIQRYGRWAFQARGSLGFQYFREDDALYFPTRADLQAAAVAAALVAPAGSLAGATYLGQTSRGVNYNVGVGAEYTLSPQVRVGMVLAADNATDFRQMSGGFYFRFPTEPVYRETDLRLNPLRSPYAY
jgi:tetratricopeptide (TPR) repeat protein